jgi:hypothetical protein
MPAETDWEALAKTAKSRAALYAAVAGLRSKAFVLAPERRQYGGLYVFDSRDALDAFLRSDLFAGAIEKFGQPELRSFEVVATVEQPG